MRVLVELSGEHPTLPEAEVRAVARGELGEVERDGRVLLAEASRDVPWARLGLSHAVGRHLGTVRFEDAGGDVEAAVEALCEQAGGWTDVESPFAVRFTDHRPTDDQDGEARAPLDARKVPERLGQALSAAGRTVDLERPESTVRVVATTRALHAHRLLHDVDRGAFEARRSHLRPFAHPTSLHPRLARAVVNLARPARGVLDPFVGTGGLVLEAALMGVPAVAGDADPAMVRGARSNLAHVAGDAAGRVGLYVGDVRALPLRPGAVDAVVADPPYGRAAASHGGPAEDLQAALLVGAAELLAPGDRLVVVLPRGLTEDEAQDAGWGLEEVHGAYVHRSLTRHVTVLVM